MRSAETDRRFSWMEGKCRMFVRVPVAGLVVKVREPRPSTGKGSPEAWLRVDV